MTANLKYALRALVKTPFVTTVAVLSLALGIGANAAIFSLFHSLLLQPLPVEAPDRLVNLSAPGPKPGSQSCNQAGNCEAVMSYPMLRDLQAEPGGFSGIAGHRLMGANLARAGESTRAGELLLVSGSYFPLLGLQASLGRLLGPADDGGEGQSFVAVLAHDYWETHLGSDPAAVGSTVTVNGQAFTVLGVAPEGFEGTTLGGQPDVFVPLSMRAVVDQGFDDFENRQAYWIYAFARLAPGASLAGAGEELNAAYRSILQEVEAPLQEGMSDQTMARFRARTLEYEDGRRGQSSIHREARTPLILLFTVTGVVLFIACANIANLLLARGATRNQEMAIRGSLGASRSQLLGQLLTESCLLALLGGAAGLVVARATLRVMAAMLPPEASSVITQELNPTVIAFTAGMALLTGVLFGLYPALHSTRTDLVSTLKSNAGQPSGARSASRFRTALVTAQLALSTALLVAAGLFIRSLLNVSRVDLGLSPDNVVTFSISPDQNGYEDEESRQLFQRVEEELGALPGVSAVSAALVPVLAGSSWGTNVRVEGFESGPDIDSNARFNAVGPGFFSLLDMQLVAGREFTPADDEAGPRVAIVNEQFTRKFGLDGRNAVGKRMSTGGEDLDIQIVGVARDAKYSEVKDDVPPLFFLPHLQRQSADFLTFYVRTGSDPSAVLRAVPQLVQRVDPTLPVEELKTLEQQVQENVFLDRMIGTLSSAFAVLATILASIGLYGVLSYTVSQRTREIGVRMALGAETRDVRRMVLRQVARMTVVGALLGIVAAFFIGQGARSLLFELEGFDPMVVTVTGALLGLVALGAALVPALRASSVDPMQALRYD